MPSANRPSANRSQTGAPGVSDVESSMSATGRRVRGYTRLLDKVPAAVVTTLAVWTVAYWAGLVFAWPVLVIGLVAVLQLVVVGVVLIRRRRPVGSGAASLPAPAADPPPAPAVLSWQVLLMAGLGGVLALGLGLSGRPAAAGALMVLGSLALLGRCWWVDRARERPEAGLGRLVQIRAESLWAAVITLGALGMAVLSTQIAHPDGDDVYFLGFATYVAERGVVPYRDAILSDQTFPAMASHDPPLESWEALVGLVARTLHLDAAHAAYALVLPLMVVVFVLALAQLVRECRVPFAPLGLGTALALLVLDGSSEATFGFMSFTRLWVGKIVLVAVVLPVLVSFAIRYLRGGRRSDAAVVFAAAVAAVGVSSSGVFLIPLLIGATVLAGWVLRRRSRAAWLSLAAIPALLCGIAMAALAPPTRTTPVAPLAAGIGLPTDDGPVNGDAMLGIFALGGGHLVVFVLALILGVLGLRSRSAQAVVVSSLLVFGTLLSTPMLQLLLAVVPNLNAVIWRLWFLVPVPLLYAALPGGVSVVLDGVRRWRPVPVPVPMIGATVTAALAVTVFAVNGPSAISVQAGTYRSHWHALKTFPGAERGVRYLDRQAVPGDVVLAPSPAARLAPVITSRWHSVAPRLDYLRTEFNRSIPEMHAVQRLELQYWLNNHHFFSDVELHQALDAVGVDLVCLIPKQTGGRAQLRRLGWQVTSKGIYTCLRPA